MKLHCDCNSKWILGGIYIACRTITGTGSLLKKSLGKCPTCEYCYWYDADYENMMFDLRTMNQS